MIVESRTKSEAPSNIWNDILRESMTKKDLEESNVFLFGDKFTGKRSLIKYINRELLQKGELEDSKKLLTCDETVSKYGLLDYTYLNVKKLSEQDSDSIGKINIWMANENINRDFFEAIVKPEFLLKALCVIVVDLSRPWDIMENLKRWTSLIYDCFSSLLLKFPYEKQQELRENICEYLKLFEEPQFDEEGNFKKEPLSEENTNLKLQLPLKEGLLKTNLAVPLIFLVNKSDVVTQTGERKRFEEDSEFILKHIRNYALTFGASIIYTSTKQNINLNVLYDYILHRIYKFDLRHKPNIMDRDSYFIPAGYDSLAVLKNFDLQNELTLFFEERVPPVKAKNLLKEDEIVCEDVNVFLKRFVDKIQRAQNNVSRRNISDYGTEDLTKNIISTDDKNATKVDDNNPSSSKVNFDIFKTNTVKNPSIDLSAGGKVTSVADKIEAIKKNHEKLLAVDRSGEKANDSITKQNLMKKLTQLRKDKNTDKEAK